ncbi:MAG: alpha/beta hydrolase [Byssovorax sp.]
MIPNLYLALSVVGAAFTWNAFRPVFRPAPLATLSFFAGWLTSELPLHHVVWQLVVTLGFAVAGALRAPAGWAGLAISTFSWLGLVRLSLRAREAEVVMERALREGLGDDYRARVLADQYPRLAPSLSRAQLFFPFFPRSAGVRVDKDVVYHQAGKLRLRLDVYRPAERPRRAPVLLFVHGGAWVLGKKDHHGLYLMTYLAAQGWVCFGVDYRLSPRATFPDHLVDVKRAIAWVKEHAEEYGADPDFVVISGGSAGGHLCSLAALTARDRSFQPGFEDADTSVSACVSLYGIYDLEDRARVWPHRGLRMILEDYVMKKRLDEDPEAFARASPIRRIEPDSPPFLVIHGDLDTMVPVDEGRRFAEAYRAVAEAPLCYAEIPGAQHAFEVFPSLRSALVFQGIARFGAWVHSAYLEQQRAPRLSSPRTIDIAAGEAEEPGDGEALSPAGTAARSSAAR